MKHNYYNTGIIEIIIHKLNIDKLKLSLCRFEPKGYREIAARA